MSKAGDLLNLLKEIKEYQFEDAYYVVPYSDRGKSVMSPLFAGGYEECVNFIKRSGNPGLVVVTFNGTEKAADTQNFRGSAVSQPQTFDQFPSNNQYIRMQT